LPSLPAWPAAPIAVGMCGGIVAALAVAGTGESLGGGGPFCSSTTWTGDHLHLSGGRCRAGRLVPEPPPLKEATLWIFVAVNLFVLLIGVGTAVGWRSLSIATLEPGGATFVGRVVERLVRGPQGAALSPSDWPWADPLWPGLCDDDRGRRHRLAPAGRRRHGGPGVRDLSGPLLLRLPDRSGLWPGRPTPAAPHRIVVAAAGLTGLWRVLGAVGFLPPVRSDGRGRPFPDQQRHALHVGVWGNISTGWTSRVR